MNAGKIKIVIAIVLCLGILGAGFLYWQPFHESRVVIENVKDDSDNAPQYVSERDISVAGESLGENKDETVENEQGHTVVKEKKEVVLPEKDKAPVVTGTVDNLLDFGYARRTARSIDTIIIHSSYDALGGDPFSVSGIIEEYRQNGVAAHYLIDRVGIIRRLVADKDVAYHAGVSRVPDGRNGVNEFSIGIEMVNTKSGEFTDKQYASLNGLLASLKSKYKIKYVLGHDQIAPGRKDDPWNMEWKKVK